MRTEIIMPQMGESIAEGTVVRWLKKPGDTVERDEDLFEISTDKVESVIPAPTSGVLIEILVDAGQKVEVGTTVGWLGDSMDEAGDGGGGKDASSASDDDSGGDDAPADDGDDDDGGDADDAAATGASPGYGGSADSGGSNEGKTAAELRRVRSTPLVRRMADEHGFEIAAVKGTGLSGRVTKKDVERYLATQKAKAAQAPSTSGGASVTFEAPEVPIGDNDRVETMGVMRQNIAEHMVMSRRVSAHCQTVHEIDVTWVEQLRRKHKAAYAERGAKLSFTVFLTKAVADALRAFPLMNASLAGDQIVFRADVNVGVAVALEQGLIVPVVKRADEKNLFGLARAVGDVATRARTKKLQPGDVQDGTFTISNAGVFGSLFGIPIISQPQVGILGVGGIKRRVMVMEDDAIGVRSVVHVCLTFDHRLIDGSVADGFVNKIKDVLGNFPEDAL